MLFTGIPRVFPPNTTEEEEGRKFLASLCLATDPKSKHFALLKYDPQGCCVPQASELENNFALLNPAQRVIAAGYFGFPRSLFALAEAAGYELKQESASLPGVNRVVGIDFDHTFTKDFTFCQPGVFIKQGQVFNVPLQQYVQQNKPIAENIKAGVADRLTKALKEGAFIVFVTNGVDIELIVAHLMAAFCDLPEAYLRRIVVSITPRAAYFEKGARLSKSLRLNLALQLFKDEFKDLVGTEFPISFYDDTQAHLDDFLKNFPNSCTFPLRGKNLKLRAFQVYTGLHNPNQENELGRRSDLNAYGNFTTEPYNKSAVTFTSPGTQFDLRLLFEQIGRIKSVVEQPSPSDHTIQIYESLAASSLLPPVSVQGSGGMSASGCCGIPPKQDARFCTKCGRDLSLANPLIPARSSSSSSSILDDWEHIELVGIPEQLPLPLPLPRWLCCCGEWYEQPTKPSRCRNSVCFFSSFTKLSQSAFVA